MRKFLNIKTLIVFLFIVLVGISIAYYFLFLNKGTKDNQAYKDAEKAYDDREYNLALSKYKEAINIDPNKTESYTKAADILIMKQKYADAIQILQYGIDFADDQATIYKKLAHASAIDHKMDQAVDYSQKAADKKSSNDNILDYANYLYLAGQNEKAEEQVKKIDGSDAKAKYLKAIINYNDLEEARALASEASAQDINNKEYSELSTLLNQLQQTDANEIENYMRIAEFAIKDENYALGYRITNSIKSSNTYYEGSYLYQAFVQLKYHQYENAIQTLRAAYIYSPNSQDLNKLLAEAYFKNGDNEQATKYIQKALSNTTLSNDTLLLALYIYDDTAKYSDALKQADKLIATEPTNPTYTSYKARDLILTGKYSDAEKLIATYISKNGQVLTDSSNIEIKAVLLSEQAYAKYKLGDASGAGSLFNEVKALFPDNAYVQYYLSLYDKATGKTSDAQTASNRAIELDTENQISKLIK